MEDDFEAVASKSSELVDVSQIVELPLIVLYMYMYIIQVLDFIFSCDELEQVIGHSFFQDVELKRAIPKVSDEFNVAIALCEFGCSYCRFV